MDTQTHAALVEELNAPDWWAAFFHGGGRLDEYRDTAPVRAAQAITDLTEELTQARADIAKLREALEDARQVLAEAPYDLEIRTTMDRIAAVLGGDTP